MKRLKFNISNFGGGIFQTPISSFPPPHPSIPPAPPLYSSSPTLFDKEKPIYANNEHSPPPPLCFDFLSKQLSRGLFVNYDIYKKKLYHPYNYFKIKSICFGFQLEISLFVFLAVKLEISKF
jgi:hypothetical protein